MARRSRYAALAIAAAAAGSFATAASASTVPPTSGPADGTAPVGTVPDPAECMAGVETVNDGVLTIATGEPAYPPYVIDDDPTSKQGFEAAVAYAVADLLGFSDDEIEWTRVAWDPSIAPGLKEFDFNIQQFSITPERAESVGFSLPYYSVPQAILGYADSPAADATSLTDLQELRIGVAAGTTAVPFVEEIIQPSEEMQVFNDNAAVKAALDAKQIDALVSDLPTAIYMSTVELENATVFGQFVASDGTSTDNLGLLTEKDNPIIECLDLALLTLRQNGGLEAITNEWMVSSVDIPVIDIDG